MTKKLVDQLLQLKAKEKIFMAFFEEYLAPGTDCPVLLEPFTQENPPYRLNSCEHRLTASVLRKLRIKNINQKFGSACMFCPVCRGTVLFAHSDNSYLQAIRTMRKINTIEKAKIWQVIERSMDQRMVLEK